MMNLSPGDPRVLCQVEVHLVGAHVCLTFGKPGERIRPVWVSWLPAECPHLAMCGQLFGRHFRVNVPLWPRSPDPE